MTRKKKPRPAKPVIGWHEWVALPEFGSFRINAKVDTGAYTSALHAFDMETFEREGEEWISFSIHPNQRDDQTSLRVEAPLHDRRKVRPSTGVARERPVVLVPVTLGADTWPIEITLVRRDMMGYRMLLGRKAVRRRFLVDPGRSYLAGEPVLPEPVAAELATSEPVTLTPPTDESRDGAP